jgi:hypothetical protein
MTYGNDPINTIVGTAGDPSPNVEFEGLIKREYFAAMAMQGLCAHPVTGEHAEPDEIAIMALEQADALIEALNKEAK